MLFARRNPPTLGQRVRVALWPRRSWSRSLRYIYLRTSRLGGTPHVIALGIAAGTFAACLPYWGIQFITAGIIAWLIRGSISAAVLGTFLANPLTVPVIWLTAYRIGDAMLGGGNTMNAIELQQGLANSAAMLWAGSPGGIAAATDILWLILMPMSLGSLPLGLATSVVFYYLTKRSVEAFQQRRQLLLQGQASLQDTVQQTMQEHMQLDGAHSDIAVKVQS